MTSWRSTRRLADAARAPDRSGLTSRPRRRNHFEPSRRKSRGIELGDGFDVAVTQNGYVVTLPDDRNIRLRIDGQWVTVHDQLVAMELASDEDTPQTGHLTLEYVERKLLVSSC
jgi:hypothetical protein